MTRLTRFVPAMFASVALLPPPSPAEPPAATAPAVRIIDFGAKLGTGFYRGGPSRDYPASRDRDANGTLDNDTVSAWPFSLETPLTPPGLDFDTDAKNARFFGGLTLYKLNNAKRRISEGHTNQNHESRDDLNFMALGEAAPGERLEGYALWLWQKADFQNGGDQFTVKFDARSFIAVQISRYWGGVDNGRWVVRDGEAWFVSQATFANEDRPFYMGREGDTTNHMVDGANNPVVRHTHKLVPTATGWAAYAPHEPFEIDFDAAAAAFAPHTFSNVTAVGFLVTRRMAEPHPVARGLLLGEPLAVKWNAFRCDAVIDRPVRPSWHADLVPAAGGWLERTEVPYALWKQVWRSAVTRQYCLELGDLSYVFRNDGTMGPLRTGGAHRASEPVTDVTWWDAIAFCNALSELEGLTPCYYADAARTNVLRAMADRDTAGAWDRVPAVYWKPDADGFRLPTPAEVAAGSSTTGVAGLADGPWEYTWDTTGTVVFADKAIHTLVGGDARGGVPTVSALPFAERPWNGSPRISFRIARNASGRPPEPGNADRRPPAAWTLTRDQVLPPATAMSPDALRTEITAALRLVTVKDAGYAAGTTNLDRECDPAARPTTAPYPLAVSATEIPYRLWNTVRNWAETHGYAFNYAGDMGSMAHQPERHEHSPDEPVTMISLQDAYAWCNALSEAMGLRPAYYGDAARTQVYRRALPFRLEMFRGPGYPNWPFKAKLPRGQSVDSGSYAPVYMDATASGFRLPLVAEWRRLDQPLDVSRILDAEWLAGNSGDTTHAVGTRHPNAVGLYDMGGNVIELTWGSTAGIIDKAPLRLGSYFARDYGARHRNLDAAEFSGVGRTHCGFRVVSLPVGTP